MLAAKTRKDTLVAGAPITVDGGTLAMTLARAGTSIVAPKYAVAMTYTRGKARRLLDEVSDAVAGYQARIFVVGGTSIVERVYATGDEGIYGGYGRVWRCTAAACDEALP